jgi:regulator of protease activity HflC (stomatin/prohibitin superfamily)
MKKYWRYYGNIDAKGKSDARIIEAEGQAKANEKLQQSITSELIEYEKAKKWSGDLPKVMTNDKSILDISAFTK